NPPTTPIALAARNMTISRRPDSFISPLRFLRSPFSFDAAPPGPAAPSALPPAAGTRRTWLSNAAPSESAPEDCPHTLPPEHHPRTRPPQARPRRRSSNTRATLPGRWEAVAGRSRCPAPDAARSRNSAPAAAPPRCRLPPPSAPPALPRPAPPASLPPRSRPSAPPSRAASPPSRNALVCAMPLVRGNWNSFSWDRRSRRSASLSAPPVSLPQNGRSPRLSPLFDSCYIRRVFSHIPGEGGLPLSMATRRPPEFFGRKGIQVGIIGCGYVGLPLALRFAEQGHQVKGFDTDPEKVAKLNAGQTYIQHIPADKIAQLHRSGAFSATHDFSEIAGRDAVIICVPTPLDERHDPDLSYVRQTALSIQPHLQRDQLIVLESTTYPGTTQELVLPILEKSGRRRPRYRFLSRLLARARGPRQQELLARPDPQSRRRHQRAQPPRRCRSLRPDCGARRRGQLHPGRGNVQAPRKHLPLRQHRPGQRAQTPLHPHGHRHLGSHRQRFHQALRLHALLSRPGPRRTLHSRRPLLSLLEGPRVRFLHPFHRAGRRDQRLHALPRGRRNCRRVERPPQKPQRFARPHPRRGL